MNESSLNNVATELKIIQPVIGIEEVDNILKVLRSGWLTEGQQTKEFEEKVKNFCGAKFAVATTSCTTAIELALRTLRIGPGDEVIVPDFTHPATGNMVRWVGANPVLVDVDLSSYNIDPAEVEKAITEKTRCIMPVSWGGNPLNMKPLTELKEKHNLFIVEDAACSLGAAYDGNKTGTMADITCFSFHPRKIITTGEGGMVVTDNPSFAKDLQKLKAFGMEMTKAGKTMFTNCGTNSKLSDVLAAIGVEQMKKIDAIIQKRIELADYYNKLLAGYSSIRVPRKDEKAQHVYQTYAPYIVKKGLRNKIMTELKKKRIETRIGTYALHLQPAFREAKRIGRLQRSKDLYENLLALPMCHSMSKPEQEWVICELKNSIKTSLAN
ncbi:MAG: DegT/DnrJ/EryC1/StrS family aminotransferase [Candidatus Bathyarchaeota archaeon]|nr:DegT/DnrJ/EryC1/StrS family aminotransferase [Candidatus Bathyarchaeota archaeon]